MAKLEEKEKFIKKIFQEINWGEEGSWTDSKNEIIRKKNISPTNALNDAYLNSTSNLWSEWKAYILSSPRGRIEEFNARKLKILERIVQDFTKKGVNSLNKEQKEKIFKSKEFTENKSEEVLWKIMDLIDDLTPFIQKTVKNLVFQANHIINNYQNGDGQSKEAYRIVNGNKNFIGQLIKAEEKKPTGEIIDHPTLQEKLKKIEEENKDFQIQNAELKRQLVSANAEIGGLNQRVQELQGMLAIGPSSQVTNPTSETNQEQIGALQNEIAELTELLIQVNLANTKTNQMTAEAYQQIADLQKQLLVTQVVMPPK